MKTILKKRGSGKTTELIKLSAQTGAVIVCSSKERANKIQIEAFKKFLNIKLPISHKEFIDKEYYAAGNTNGFLIDDADMLLQSLTRVKIIACSITEEDTTLHQDYPDLSFKQSSHA